MSVTHNRYPRILLLALGLLIQLPGLAAEAQTDAATEPA